MAAHLPYLDFKYGDHWASEYHLYRVSNGSRYNTNLIPTLTDKTVETPGADGMYFFNTYYKQRQFTIDVAFDSVTEQDLRDIRNWLNGKEIKKLIFPEHTVTRQNGNVTENIQLYYNAKVTGSPTLKFIAFDQPNTINSPANTDIINSSIDSGSTVIYKGEGSIQFTCYDPYAYSNVWYVIDSSYQNIATIPDEEDTRFGERDDFNGTLCQVQLVDNPTFFEYHSSQGFNIGDSISIYQYPGNNVIHSIILKEKIKATDFSTGKELYWNSRTGIIMGTVDLGNDESIYRPVKFEGNSGFQLPIAPTSHGIHLNGNITGYQHYLKFQQRYL